MTASVTHAVVDQLRERMGVEVRPVCVNASRWDCTLEPTDDEDRFAAWLGLRMVKGLANADAASIIAARADQPFVSVDDLWRRAPRACCIISRDRRRRWVSVELASRPARGAVGD